MSYPWSWFQMERRASFWEGLRLTCFSCRQMSNLQCGLCFFYISSLEFSIFSWHSWLNQLSFVEECPWSFGLMAGRCLCIGSQRMNHGTVQMFESRASDGSFWSCEAASDPGCISLGHYSVACLSPRAGSKFHRCSSWRISPFASKREA